MISEALLEAYAIRELAAILFRAMLKCFGY